MIPDAAFRPGLELICYLDGNLSSNGIDDPALAIRSFEVPGWTENKKLTSGQYYLCSTTLRSALEHHRRELIGTQIGVPHHVSDFTNELNKPAYTWHSAVNDTIPIHPNDCTRCRLYRAIAVGVMDQVRDVHNMVHGCEIANEAKRDVGIRRASGFNELHEAAVKKDWAILVALRDAGIKRASEQSIALGLGIHSGSDEETVEETVEELGSGAGQQFGPEVESLKELMKQLARSFGNDMAPSKWTWGVELTDDDLRGLIRGADRQGHDSHTGYDSPLPSNFSHGKISSSLDPYKLEDPQSTQLLFDRLSSSIATIPELPPDEFPSYLEINGEP